MRSRSLRLIVSIFGGLATTLSVGLLIGFTAGPNSWLGWIFELGRFERFFDYPRDSYVYEGVPSPNFEGLKFALWSALFAFIFYRLLTSHAKRSNQALQPTAGRLENYKGEIRK